jgi:hypothetical protein
VYRYRSPFRSGELLAQFVEECLPSFEERHDRGQWQVVGLRHTGGLPRTRLALIEPEFREALDLRRLSGAFVRDEVEELGIDQTPAFQRLDDVEGVLGRSGVRIHIVGDFCEPFHPEEHIEFTRIERFLEEVAEPLVFAGLARHRWTRSIAPEALPVVG